MVLRTKVKKPKVLHPFERLDEWVLKVPKFINPLHVVIEGEYSLDVENKPDGSFLGIGLSDGHRCFYWTDWFMAKGLQFKPFIAHSGTGDIEKLKNWGFRVDESYLFWDTLLVEHIIDSSQRDYSLTTLTRKHLGAYYPDYEEICKKDKSFADFPAELIAEKNFCDTYYTWKLYQHQLKRLY